MKRIFALVLLALAGASAVQAQSCYGTAPRGGIAVDHGSISFGSTNGVSGAIASDHFALGAGFRTLDRGSGTSGDAVNIRFAGIVGGGGLQICPGLGFEYQHNKWDAPTGALSSQSLTGWAGVSVGFEKRINSDFSVIPFGGIRFAFTAIKYDFSETATDVRTTGDTLSRGEFQYGLLGRYKVVYVGFIADHGFSSAPPYLTRWVLGLTFPFRNQP
jgi:opacity protein-like surface antigen